MGKVIIVLALVMLLGCKFVTYPLIGLDHPVLSTQEEVLEWVADEITYRAEPDLNDNWQTPEETLATREGDCEDFVILSMYLLDLISIESNMAVVTTSIGKHAVLYVNDVFIESQQGAPVWYEYSLDALYSYSSVMEKAYNRF
jgi:hypothetical protein